MKNRYILILLIVTFIGCSSNNESLISWKIYDSSSEDSAKQLIYYGEKNASYRIYCSRADVPVIIEVDGVRVHRMLEGQSVDIEGKRIEVLLSSTGTAKPKASGTYERIQLNQNK